MAAQNLGSTNKADSAGFPWAGRAFESNEFANDDGSTPEVLALALTRFAEGAAGPESVVDAFRSARLLIPLVTEAGDIGFTEDGRQVDKTQELSIVTVAAPDGRRALPVFSCVAAMAEWNPLARPVPADGIRVALAAAGEETDLVVLDPGAATEFVLRRPTVWAVAQENPWSPAWRDPEVAFAFESSVADEPAVVAVELSSGDPRSRLAAPELAVRLRLVPGLGESEVAGLVQRLQIAWSRSELIADRVDSMALTLAAA
ncbi:SseB family protein [Klugiella xanthotipulae]|uniref:Type III secretion system (T3SS) SseB-like protein n=1 Tax=Klugiella xanthotipulae TaxID=244735 RepID=A0A543I402_9MICO|nr:SseB family protein [Klugiella xanthotipulae]TQM65324.1 type III secretion system (T3SS) SseB-like protein [Klugiella xanthotipulae]